MLLRSAKPKQRPIGFAEIDISNPLNKGAIYLSHLDSTYARNLVNNYPPTPNSTVIGVGGLGPALTFDATTDNQIISGFNLSQFVPLDKVTIVLVKQKTDTTVRVNNVFGRDGTTDKCSITVPNASSDIVFGFGSDSLTATGQSWDRSVDYFVFVSGPSNGRAIWRNGAKLASDTSSVRDGTNTNQTLFGYNGSIGTDVQRMYLFGLYDAEWNDDAIRSWFDDPFQLFKTRKYHALAQRIGNFPTSGALVGQGSVVSGTASNFSTLSSSGALVGPGSSLSGNASLLKLHTSTGALQGQSSEISGAANKINVHASSGSLSGQGSSVNGTASSYTVHSITGVLSGQSSILSGTAVLTTTYYEREFILVEMPNNNVIVESKQNTIITEITN